MFRVLSVQSSFLWTLSCKFNHFGLSSLTAPSPELRESTNSICLFLSQPVNLLMAISRDNHKVCMVQGSLTFLPDAQCFENCYFILIVCFILSCFFSGGYIRIYSGISCPCYSIMARSKSIQSSFG